jgi:hypothetical protein
MDIKIGDVFLCISDFISVVDNTTILYTKGKYYSIDKIVGDDCYYKLYYLKSNNNRNYWFVLDKISQYYIYNYFDTIRSIRNKKMKKLNNLKIK